MSTYGKNTFKGFWGSPTGPFSETLGASVSGAVLQQMCVDIGDSALFSDSFINTDVNFFESCDWLTNSLSQYGFVTNLVGVGAAAGVGSSYGQNSTERAMGILSAETGTTAAGVACVYKGAFFQAGLGHTYRFRKRIAVDTLGSAGENYTIYFGLGDVLAGGDQTNGAYFRYNYNVNGGKVECVTANGAVRTAQDTGVLMDTTYHVFEIRINATGTSVDFYIDGANLKTSTTNINVTSGLSMILKIDKNAGTTTRKVYEDYYDFTMNLASTR